MKKAPTTPNQDSAMEEVRIALKPGDKALLRAIVGLESTTMSSWLTKAIRDQANALNLPVCVEENK